MIARRWITGVYLAEALRGRVNPRAVSWAAVETPVFAGLLERTNARAVAEREGRPVLVSWPDDGLAPVARVTCSTCGVRSGVRAKAWTTKRHPARLYSASFRCPSCLQTSWSEFDDERVYG